MHIISQTVELKFDSFVKCYSNNVAGYLRQSAFMTDFIGA